MGIWEAPPPLLPFLKLNEMIFLDSLIVRHYIKELQTRRKTAIL